MTRTAILSLSLLKNLPTDVRSIGCIIGAGRCGVALNSLFMAIIVGALTTVLGLVFALLVTRTNLKFRRVIVGNERVADYHPAFCDWAGHHFVIWTFRHCDHFIADVLGVAPTIWIYGLPYSCPDSCLYANCLRADWRVESVQPLFRNG